MKKIIPLLLILAILFSGCTSQKDVDNSSDLSNDSTTGESISTTDTDENIDSSTGDTTSTDNDSVIDGTSEGSAPSGKTPSNNSSSTKKPHHQVIYLQVPERLLIIQINPQIKSLQIP